MSDCSTNAFHANVEPIRGKIAYTDGTCSEFTYSRVVNGNVRTIDHIEVDGERYVGARRLHDEDFTYLTD